ncbi:MAG: hypothetical protein KI790_15905 [Cyclobacteriaceae bacterium]|nr:hypothetical protein [Cyclobacteriaceae bacterium HetDA_MAG_MS6]
MKMTINTFSLTLLLCLPILGFSQEVQEKKSQNFVLLYRTGEAWDASKSPNEQPYFLEHSAHLAALRKAGKIAIGGRYSDKGLIILRVENETEAKQILSEDISVRHGTFKAELFPLSTFYKGCVE